MVRYWRDRKASAPWRIASEMRRISALPVGAASTSRASLAATTRLAYADQQHHWKYEIDHELPSRLKCLAPVGGPTKRPGRTGDRRGATRSVGRTALPLVRLLHLSRSASARPTPTPAGRIRPQYKQGAARASLAGSARGLTTRADMVDHPRGLPARIEQVRGGFACGHRTRYSGRSLAKPVRDCDQTLRAHDPSAL